MGGSQAADFARHSILNSIAGAPAHPGPPHKGEGEQGSIQLAVGISPVEALTDHSRFVCHSTLQCLPSRGRTGKDDLPVKICPAHRTGVALDWFCQRRQRPVPAPEGAKHLPLPTNQHSANALFKAPESGRFPEAHAWFSSSRCARPPECVAAPEPDRGCQRWRFERR